MHKSNHMPVKYLNSSRKVIFLLFSAILGGLIYFPILNNAFLADDYDSLFRVVIERRVIVKEFFRPMIDWTFRFNYILSGMNPFSYYVFNLLVHIFNVWLVYQLVLNIFRKEISNREQIAVLSGFLFLIYPFHNEGVAWLTGRLASIACFFSLLSINILLGRMFFLLKALLIVFFYLLGLLAYESIFLLPVILFFFWWNRLRSKRQIGGFLLISAIVNLSYVSTRYLLSGVVYGEYGERMVVGDPFMLLEKFLKVFGRTLLPPMENTSLLVVLFVFSFSLICFVFFKVYRNGALNQHIAKIILAFFISMIIPLLFGLSTRTSEGDRLLYFPSVFLVIVVAWSVMQFTVRWHRNVFLGSIVIYFLTFLYVNNAYWERASKASGEIITELKQSEKPAVLINLPDEVEGAFVFRNGFHKALLLNHVDTSRVRLFNFLTKLDYLPLPGTIRIDTTGDGYFIAPVTRLKKVDNVLEIENLQTEEKVELQIEMDVLYFWDRHSLKKVY